MEFIYFLGEMLGITKDFAITKIEKNELEKTINIHIEYLPPLPRESLRVVLQFKILKNTNIV